MLETSGGLVELDSVVWVRDRVSVFEDALRTGDEATRTLELAVVERENPRVEKRVRAHVGVLVREDPLAGSLEAPLGFLAVAAVEGDVNEVVVFRDDIQGVAQALVQIAAFEVECARLVEPPLHPRRRGAHVEGIRVASRSRPSAAE